MAGIPGFAKRERSVGNAGTVDAPSAYVTGCGCRSFFRPGDSRAGEGGWSSGVGRFAWKARFAALFHVWGIEEGRVSVGLPGVNLAWTILCREREERSRADFGRNHPCKIWKALLGDSRKSKWVSYSELLCHLAKAGDEGSTPSTRSSRSVPTSVGAFLYSMSIDGRRFIILVPCLPRRQASAVRNFVFGVEDSLVSTVGLLSGIAVVCGRPAFHHFDRHRACFR